MAIKVSIIDGMGKITESSGTFTTTGANTVGFMQSANDFLVGAGVVNLTTDYIVTQHTPAGMSVDVSAGTAYVQNGSWSANSSTETKYWRVLQDASSTVSITNANPSNPRIDIVCIKVDTLTTPDDSASNVGTIVVIAGTPAVSPSVPATPANHYKLAQVTVGTGATSITNSVIVNTRGCANINATNYGMARQAIINGNFDIAQRGTSFTNPANDSITLDRLKMIYSADGGTLPTSIVVAQSQLTPGNIFGTQYAMTITPNGSGSGFGANSLYETRQYIENGTRKLCGNEKTVTISFYAQTGIGGKKLGVYLLQNYGTGGSPTSAEIIPGSVITIAGAWQKYSMTFTTNTLVGKTFGTANNDYLGLVFCHQWGATTGSQRLGAASAESFVGSGVIYIAQVQLCSGSVALPFQPKSFDEELRACQRYCYSVAMSQSSTSVATGLCVTTTKARFILYLPVTMRTVPALTATASDWNVSDEVTMVTAGTAIAMSAAQNSTQTPSIDLDVSSGLTQFRHVNMRGNANAVLILSAEL